MWLVHGLCIFTYIYRYVREWFDRSVSFPIRNGYESTRLLTVANLVSFFLFLLWLLLLLLSLLLFVCRSVWGRTMCVCAHAKSKENSLLPFVCFIARDGGERRRAVAMAAAVALALNL